MIVYILLFFIGILFNFMKVNSQYLILNATVECSGLIIGGQKIGFHNTNQGQNLLGKGNRVITNKKN